MKIPGNPKSIHDDARFRQSELSYQLEYMRKTAHFSIKNLSLLTGLSSRTIWKMENDRDVNLSTLLVILEALRYEIEFIAIGTKVEREKMGL